MVLMFLFIPLWVILFYRFKSGTWITSLTGKYNLDWEVPLIKENPHEVLPDDITLLFLTTTHPTDGCSLVEPRCS